MIRLPAYLRKPSTPRTADRVVPTERGWELVTDHPRQQPRVIVACRNLFNLIIETEEEIGAERFKELAGYNASDFMEATEATMATEETKEPEQPANVSEQDAATSATDAVELKEEAPKPKKSTAKRGRPKKSTAKSNKKTEDKE